MESFMQSNHIVEKKITIGEIPALLFRPNDSKGLIPTIVFYHGWSSSKEGQRMRAFILTSLGYQVIIPDAIYHGERNALGAYNEGSATKYFWDVIFQNIEEFRQILDEVVQNYQADPERIGVMGNSMGGMTAAGIFTHYHQTKALVVLNGSCAWQESNKQFKQSLGIDIEAKELEEKVREMDPMNHLKALVDRPILLLHGEHDTVVPVSSQKIFYESLKPLQKDGEKLKIVTYEYLNHFVTTEMMEESAIWFHKYL